jgi:mono/diheme cytochrome c family protein
MKARQLSLIALASLLVGCSLAGDITPPPGLQPELPAATVPPTAVTTPASVAAAFPQEPADLPHGEEIFAENCAPCHGVRGLGDGSQAADLPVPVPALGDPELARDASPADWYRTVTEGVMERFMPPFRSLADADRWDVVAYALSLSSSEEELAQAGRDYAEHCAGCHGPEGSGEAAPELADARRYAQVPTTELFEVISEGVEAMMPAFSEDLTEQARWGLAAFIQRMALTRGVKAEETIVEEEPPAAPEQGRIRGQVINGTNQGEVPEGLEVTLHGFDGQDEVVLASTTVGEEGRFAFEDVPNHPGRLFVVTADYQGAIYGSEVLHLTSEGEAGLRVQIFESTPSPAALRADRLHMVFDVPEEGRLRVMELWVFSNLGDRAVAPAEGEGGLEIALPQGARGLSFDTESAQARFEVTEQGFRDLASVRPGEGTHQLVFNFELPYEGQAEFSQPVAFPPQAIVLLTRIDGPRLSGRGVEELGVREMGGSELRLYELVPPPKDGELALVVRGGLGTGNSSGLGVDPIGLVVGAGVLVLAAAVLRLWWVRSSAKRVPEPRRGRPAALEPELALGEGEQALVQQLADLDDDYAAGEIEAGTYESRREQLKRKLLDSMESGRD